MAKPRPLISEPVRALQGTVAVPGDKSISHRALMLGSLAVGETRVCGLLEGEDVLATAAAMRMLGAQVERGVDGTWCVSGLGVGGLAEPKGMLDMGNSGTAARLLLGILASHPFTAFLTGDASLCARPMERVMEPLRRIGASFVARSGGRLPLAVTGAASPIPIEYALPVPSAQVKSAILFAGLGTPGRTTVIEREPTRDHSELMLRHFGADVTVTPLNHGGRAVSIVGQPELVGRDVEVPGDISSAAFPLSAALLAPDSRVTVRNVGINPLRAGLIETLRDMGGTIEIVNRRDQGGEPIADLVASTSALHGVDVPAERAPSMIDEYPIVAMAAALARGPTRLFGLAELRVKESDRLAAIARGLAAAGVRVEEGKDTLVVHGVGGAPKGDAAIPVNLDHRIAMAFLVLGMVSRAPITIDDAAPIDTSFPGFVDLMNGLGGRVRDAVP
jgi:3-phosphoshikimate 1-carboxyvinyltransferase